MLANTVPLQYVIMRPGPATNVLGTTTDAGGKQVPLIKVTGHPTYPTSGALDFTTVMVSGGPGRKVTAMDLLQANPGVTVLYAANDYMAEGAALAVKSLGRTDVQVYGYDGDTAAIEAIANKDGITATTNTNPVAMGAMAAQYAIDLLNRKAQVGYVDAPTEIVTGMPGCSCCFLAMSSSVSSVKARA